MSKQHRELANSIRFLSIDAVQKANSGHPGMPMGMADVATVLFKYFLKFNPKNPDWLNRDRFVLSAGHGSMLLYSLLYLTGYKSISLNNIKKFRQLNSICAGHPEYHPKSGIETTTGPLGQGIGNAVGLAIAQSILEKKIGKKIFNHKTYVLAGDGCLMDQRQGKFQAQQSNDSTRLLHPSERMMLLAQDLLSHLLEHKSLERM